MEGITISQDLPPRVAPNTPIEMPKFGFGAAPIGDLFIDTPDGFACFIITVPVLFNEYKISNAEKQKEAARAAPL